MYKKLIFCLFLLLSVNLFSDEVEIYGVKINVGDTYTIDDKEGQVGINLFGEESIVTKEELPKLVLKKSLENNYKFEELDLSKIVLSSLKNADKETAVLSFNQFLRNKYSLSSIRGLIKEIFRLSNGRSFLDSSVSKNNDSLASKELVLVLFELGVSPQKQIKLSEEDEISLMQEIEEEFYETLLKEDLSRIGEIIEFTKNNLTEKKYFQKLDKIKNLYRQGNISLRQGNFRGAQKIAELLSLGKDLPSTFSSSLVKSLHLKAQTKLNAREYARTIEILSLVSVNYRTPTTHALLSDALKNYSLKDFSRLTNAQVEDFIRSLARKDPEIKKTYLEILENQSKYLVEEGYPRPVDEILSTILIFRNDPNPKNDAIRMEQLKLYSKQDKNTLAKDKLKDIKTPIGLFDKITLFFSGLYIDRSLAFFYSSLPFILLFIFALFRAWRNKRNHEAKNYVRGRKLESASAGSNSRSGEIFASRKNSFSPEVSEYQRGLIALGLKPGDNLDTIKKTYRKLIKKVHPDNPNVSEQDTERFLKLTNTYERVLELHDLLGL